MNTLSTLINSVIQFEEDLSNVYKKITEKIIIDDPFFENLEKETLKICRNIERAYRDSVTDTLESTFFLNNVELPLIRIDESASDYKKEILKLESDCVQFYENITKHMKDYNKIIYRYFAKLLEKHKLCYNKLKEIME